MGYIPVLVKRTHLISPDFSEYGFGKATTATASTLPLRHRARPLHDVEALLSLRSVRPRMRLSARARSFAQALISTATAFGLCVIGGTECLAAATKECGARG